MCPVVTEESKLPELD